MSTLLGLDMQGLEGKCPDVNPGVFLLTMELLNSYHGVDKKCAVVFREWSANMSIELFYSYAHEDEPLRQELEKHLSLLKQQGYITGWHDRDISGERMGAGDR